MNIDQLRHHWNKLGEEDAYWAVLTEPSKINNKWDVQHFYQTGRNELHQIFQTIGLQDYIHTGHVLDFGCGPGRLTQAFCRQFEQVTGVDISSSMIEKAKAYNQYPDKCTYFTNPKNNLHQFQDESFDLVFSYITLQHIRPVYIWDYLKEFLRLSKKGKFLLFNLPSTPPLYYRILVKIIGFRGLNILRQLYFRKKWIIEMHWINRSILEKQIEAWGGKIVKIQADQSVGESWESYFYLVEKI